MNEKGVKWFRFIYGAVTGCFCILTGFCLIAACVGIYRSGEKPFSREAVATAFQGISILVYLCLALIVIGFLLSLFLPDTRIKGQLPPADMTLRRLLRKLDIEQSGPTLEADIASLQRTCRVNRWITAGWLTVSSIVFLSYACNSDNFHPQDINGSVAKATLLLLICLSFPACYGLVAKMLAKRSMEKQIQLLLKFGVTRTEPFQESDRNTGIRVTRLILLGLAIIITLYGLLSGGTLDVLTKAVNICTECIGLG